MKYPIGLSIILNALAAISILSGCSDYLDREYDSFIDNEMTFTSYERTSKFLVNAYRYLPDGFNRIGSEAMLDAATDDAEHANASCNIQHFNTGAWNSRSNPDDLWNKYYAGIRIANEFIENVDRVNLDKYRLDPDNQNEYQNRLNDLKTWKYEARFLRAFFHFELVKRFGPVPVITSTLSVNADYSETPRPSMDDCISFISSECDKVAEVLDLTPGRGIDSDLGRATKGAALALKSRVLLYAASPLYLDWQNFSESDLNINTVADIFGYHRVSLARLLKKKTNLTFSEHLLNARMRAALAMMQLGEQSVKHIAYSVGYTNPLYFTTQFTQLYGESPKKL